MAVVTLHHGRQELLCEEERGDKVDIKDPFDVRLGRGQKCGAVGHAGVVDEDGWIAVVLADTPGYSGYRCRVGEVDLVEVCILACFVVERELLETKE